MKFPIRHFLILALIAFLFLSPILSHIHYWGIHDWDSIAADYLVGRNSILKYGQWPFWNPYAGGGIPLIGNQTIFCLSPLFPNSSSASFVVTRS